MGQLFIETARFGNVTKRDIPPPRSSVIRKKVHESKKGAFFTSKLPGAYSLKSNHGSSE